MAEQNQTKPKFRTSIGGQALIEGILMRGPEKQAIVVRSKEGLVEKVEELKLIRDRYPILGLPVLRGAVTFVDSMVRGVKALMYSADFFPEEEGEPSKLDLWLEKKLGSEKLQKHVEFLFSQGSVYSCVNGNLLYHGAVPMDEDGQFTTVRFWDAEYSGKRWFDCCDRCARMGYFAPEGSWKRQVGICGAARCRPSTGGAP